MKKLIAVAMASLFALTVAGCGSSAEAGKELVIVDGNYSEVKLIHRMAKQLIEDQTDLKVTLKDEMTPVNSFNELVKGGADLMTGYDGTLLTTYLKRDPKDVPAGTSIYDYAYELGTKEKQVHMMGKLGIDNTYAIAVPQAIADKHSLNTVSDLVPVAGELIFGAEHEFFDEEGSMKYTPFIKAYGLNFKEGKSVDLGLKYSAVESGNLDVTVVYATDGLNKKAGLKVLEDDLQFFPDYNGALLVRDDTFEKFKGAAPNLEEVLEQLTGSMTNEEMVEMTYAVDVDGKTLDEVAKEFLTSKGLLK